MDTDGFDAENRAEHIDQGRLGLGAWGHGRTFRCPGSGQRAPVHLAAGGERHGIQFDEAGGHHVPGQALRQVLGELVHRHEIRYVITDQVGAVGRRLFVDHGGGPDTRAGRHDGLDLAEAHPVAADLDLIVDPAEVLEVAVRAPAGEVTRSVTAAAGHPLVRDERGRGLLVPAPVAAGDTDTGDVEFAGNADRATISAFVEDEQRDVVDRPADRHRLDRPGRRALVAADVHRRLGRPVEIDQPRRRRPPSNTRLNRSTSAGVSTSPLQNTVCNDETPAHQSGSASS